MKPIQSPLLTMIGNGFSTFFKILPALLIFEIIYKALCAAVFDPVLSFIMQKALQISGYDVVFNGDIASFFTNAPGIIGTVILGILAALLAYFEFSVIILMAYYRYTGSHISLVHSMKMALTTFKSLKSLGFIGFAIYALGLLPLLNLGFAPSIRPESQIPNFISGELYKSGFGTMLMVAFYVILYLLFFCMIFVLPIMILRRRKFGRSCRFSLALLLSMKLRNALPLALMFVLWCVLFLYPGILPTYYAGISDATVAEILGTFFFSWKSILRLLLTEGLQICLSILLFTFLVALYVVCSGKVSLNEQAMPAIDRRLKKTHRIVSKVYGFFSRMGHGIAHWIQGRPFYQNHKKPIWAVVIVLLFLSVFGLLYNQPNSQQQVVVGHRGSQAGVENTLQAIEGAATAGADYAEIDILLSKDGVPMVIHDDNLKRLTGKNLNVYDLTANELSKLTVSQNGKTGKIPTLDQAIRDSRGKIDLLIELKIHGHEKENLVKAVVQVVEKNHFQKNCQFMSQEHDLIATLKSEYPQYAAGYCVYGNLGTANLSSLQALNVDFLIIEESMATKSFIAECNRAWLPVYVWTVNQEQSMETCLKLGAAGIITDKPKAARSILDRIVQDSM